MPPVATKRFKEVATMLAFDQLDRVDQIKEDRRVSRSDVLRDLIDRGLRDYEKEEKRTELMRQMEAAS